MSCERAFRWRLVGVSAMLFVASVALTIVGCRSMSAMGEMLMPGGWTMSMVWMRMPGQTWPGIATSFVGMWTVMMVAMMLPSLVPVLWRYREAVGRSGGTRLAWLTTLVGVAYFGAWALFGAVVFPLGIALAMIEMRAPELARLVPVAIGVAVLIAGAFQFTSWKARYLECCRETHWRGRMLPAATRSAWQSGVQLAVHCGCCGAGLTTVLLTLGVMDLRVMAVVAVASNVERLVPAGQHVTRGIGGVAVGAGLAMIARAVAIG